MIPDPKALALSLANANHKVVTEADGETLLSVQITKSNLDMVIKLLESVEVLKFYARPETYFAIAFFDDPPSGEFMEDFSDDHGDNFCDGFRPGKKAREVLDKLGIDWYDDDEDE